VREHPGDLVPQRSCCLRISRIACAATLRPHRGPGFSGRLAVAAFVGGYHYAIDVLLGAAMALIIAAAWFCHLIPSTLITAPAIHSERKFGRRARRYRWKESCQCLARFFPDEIDHRDTMHARNRAIRGTRFPGPILALKVVACVLLQWDGRITSLLGTVVDESVFADIKIAASCAALPIVWLSPRQVPMEEVVISERPEGGLPLVLYLLVNSSFPFL